MKDCVSNHSRWKSRFISTSLALICSYCAATAATPKNILYVINTVQDPATTANANDQEVRDRLVAQGHTVTLADDTTVTVAETTGMDLVLISSSSASGEPGINPLSLNTLRSGRIPVVCYEPGLYDELGLQTATTFGNAAGHTHLGIVSTNRTHPLAAGTNGIVQVVVDGATATFSYAATPLTLGADAIIIATNATPAHADIGRVATWAHDRGSRLADNASVTPSRKVAFFYNASTGVGVFNEAATAMLDAAINWATEPATFLSILAVWRSPAAQNAIPNAPLRVELEDGTQQVNTNSITLSLNDSPVAASSVSISKSGAITTVSFQPTTLLPASSTNRARVVYSDNASPANTFTNTFQFVVAPYVTLPSSLAYPVGSADAATPGFKARVVQANTASGTLVNSSARAEAQLAGTLIDPATQQPFVDESNPAGRGADGFFVDADVINWNQDAQGVGAELGNFRAPASPDEPIPGIPGIDGINTDNIAAEILTYLELPAGAHTFGVNSDDGFVLAVGAETRDLFRIPVGVFEGGRGFADSIFTFVASTAGVYPFRLIWYEGNGGANLEFFSVDPATGQKILINNRTNSTAIRASRQVTVPSRPFVTSVSPARGATDVAVTVPVQITFVPGAAGLDTNSIQIALNGQAVAVTGISQTSSNVVVTADPPANLTNGITYTVQLTFSDKSTPVLTRTEQFSFISERRPLLQDGNGLVVVEAEQFDLNVPQGGHEWVLFTNTPAGFNSGLQPFSGGAFMYSLPDAGDNRTVYPDFLTLAPRLDFRVQFNRTGTHYLWVRGSHGGGDSLHGGIDGDSPDTAIRIDGAPGYGGERAGIWNWIGQIQGNTRTTIEVPTVGVHTVNIWMRENGTMLDKLLVTSDINFTPTGLGPAQSTRVGEPQPPTVSLTSPTAGQEFVAGSAITLTATASDADGTVSKVEFFEGTNKIAEATSAPFTTSFTPAAAGVYAISARATDNATLTSTSGTAQILVQPTGNPQRMLFLGNNPLSQSGDLVIIDHLLSRGFGVTVLDDDASATTDAAGKVLVVISSTVGSGAINVKFTDVAVPIISWEEALFDELKMTGNSDTAPDHHGSTGNLTQIDILNPSHPLAAGLSGTVTVTSSPQTMSWGVSDANPTNAIVIARVAGDPAKWAIWAYDKGGTLFDNTAAPDKRIGFFFNGGSTTANTADATRLFDAAVNWALGTPTGPQMQISKQANNQISISWTGTGTLESTTTIGNPSSWATVDNATNPYNISPTGPMQFFRVRR